MLTMGKQEYSEEKKEVGRIKKIEMRPRRKKRGGEIGGSVEEEKKGGRGRINKTKT